MTDKQSIVIQTEGVEIKITPFGLHRFAKEYLSVAKLPEIEKYVPINENIEKEIRKAKEYYYKKDFEYYEAIRIFKDILTFLTLSS